VDCSSPRADNSAAPARAGKPPEGDKLMESCLFLHCCCPGSLLAAAEDIHRNAVELIQQHEEDTTMRNAISSLIVALAVTLSATTALAKQGHKQKTEQVVNVEVTTKGFVPARIPVKAGRPVKLVVTRKTDSTCAKDIVIKDFKISKPLPLDKPVEVTFTPTKSGEIRYACAMDMIAGVIIVD
jgi:plastocyanin